MTEPYVVVLLTLAVAALLKLTVLLVWGNGSLARVWLATRVFRAVLGDPKIAAKVEPVLVPEPIKPVKPSGAPLRLLSLLQRDGRVLDFFLEDISGATDDQIGAGVRELHKKARHVIEEHLVLEPVIGKEEGATVEIPQGFDPSAIRLTGNVTGKPPFKGTLKHHGWRVKEFKLPPPPEGQDEFIVMPADVELP